MRLCALINSCSPRSDPVIVLISRWGKWGAEKLSKLPRVTQPALAMEEPWLPGSTGPRVKSEEVCTDGTSTAGECCQGADWGDVLALGQDPSPCHGGGGGKAAKTSNLDKEVSFHPAEDWCAPLGSPTAQSWRVGAAEGRVGLDLSVNKAGVGRVRDRAGNDAEDDMSCQRVFGRGDRRARAALGKSLLFQVVGWAVGGESGRRRAAISVHPDTGDFKDPSRVDSRLRCLLLAPLPNSLCHLRLRLTFSHFLCIARLSKLASFHYLCREQSRLGIDYFIYLVFPTHFHPKCPGINGSLASL